MKVLLIIASSLLLVWNSNVIPEGEILIDNFQNVYGLTNDELVKLNQNGQIIYTYSSVSKGDIHSVDITNPLRILVHFKENNEVVFLDNTLTVQKENLNFNTQGFYDVTLVCNSFQNHLWVYRSAEQKLVRLNQQGTQVAETPMLNSIFTDDTFVFNDLAETGNHLYLTSTSGGVYMFDQYGNYFKEVKTPVNSKVKFEDENIIYQTQDEVLLLNLKLQAVDTLLRKEELPAQDSILDFSKTHIATLNSENQISLYKFD